MTFLSQYLRTQAQVQKLRLELDVMRRNARLAHDLEMREKVLTIVADYGRDIDDLAAIVDLERGYHHRPLPRYQPSGAHSPMLVYKNPHTGRVIETRGQNHRELKQWKQAYGTDVVLSWLIDKRE
ncbi:histone-like nucleoid-structuring protein, MvaT/MvaU family [Salinicola sp. NYA28a]